MHVSVPKIFITTDLIFRETQYYILYIHMHKQIYTWTVGLITNYQIRRSIQQPSYHPELLMIASLEQLLWKQNLGIIWFKEKYMERHAQIKVCIRRRKTVIDFFPLSHQSQIHVSLLKLNAGRVQLSIDLSRTSLAR